MQDSNTPEPIQGPNHLSEQPIEVVSELVPATPSTPLKKGRGPNLDKAAFVEAVLDGKTQWECIAAAGSKIPHGSPRVWYEYRRMRVNPKVVKMIEKKAGKALDMASYAFGQGVIALTAMIETGECPDGSKARAKDIIEAMRLLGEYRGLFEEKVKIQLGVLPRISHLDGEVIGPSKQLPEGDIDASPNEVE